MKQTTLLLLGIIFNTTLSFSQDIITTKSGEDILAKILEIGHTEIKYKKFDNPGGPVYVLLKSDVLMIRYDNGTKEIFNQQPKSNTVSPSNSSKANQLPQGSVDERLLNAGKVEKYRKMKHTGTVLTVLGGILFVVGVVTLENSVVTNYSNGQTTTTGNANAGAAAFVFGMAGLGVGIPLWAVGAHNERKYNTLSFRFNANPRGRGLTLAYRF
jgi:hypothetical protein